MNLASVIFFSLVHGRALPCNTHTKTPTTFFFVSLGIIAKHVHGFNASQDLSKLCAALLGTAVGFVCADFIAHTFEDSNGLSSRGRRKSHTQRQRTVQFRNGAAGDKRRHAVSDITSIDSDSELIPSKEKMNPIERDIAALRARASLADSERRRYKEERKWAISQGNIARASQMKWEVKRYTALMENFNKQADAKVLEAARLSGNLRAAGDPSQAASSSRTRPTHANGSARQTEARETSSNRTTQHASQDRAPHHRQFSGTLKSAMRDSIR